MKEEQILTGYPHLDNIHKKYYGEKGQKAIEINKTMYRYIKDRADQYKGIAISFYGEDITYLELMQKIEKYATAFHNLGLRKGDIVTFLLPSMPETYYMFYALDMLGIARNIVDLRTSIEGIKKYINETESKTLICLNSFNPSKVKELLNSTSIKRVITTNAPFSSIKSKIKQSIGKGVVWVEGIGYKSLGNQIICPEEFKNAGATQVGYNIEAPYVPEETTLYVHTSGTIKFPKTIMSTDECQNFVAAEYEKSLMDLQEHDRFLAIMPPWILYGIMGFHMPLSLGMTVYPIPDPSSAKFDELVLDIKPNHVAGVPNHFISLLESKKIKRDTDLSFGKTYACGGAPINSTKQDEVSEFLIQHGSKSRLSPGYAFSENTSIGTANQGDYYKLGSVGIPLPDIEVMVVDREDHHPLKFNETGIICLRGALMKGYLGDKEETDKVIIEHEGKKWALSGDIGHVDEEGFIFIEGREKNVIIAHDGFKIAPNEIESKICQHPEVKNCIVFGTKDERYEFGDVAIAFIELKEKNRSKQEESKIIKEIKQLCEKELSSYYQPFAYYVGKIPYTPMMKDDKIKMREMYATEKKKNPVKKLVFKTNIYK